MIPNMDSQESPDTVRTTFRGFDNSTHEYHLAVGRALSLAQVQLDLGAEPHSVRFEHTVDVTTWRIYPLGQRETLGTKTTNTFTFTNGERIIRIVAVERD